MIWTEKGLGVSMLRRERLEGYLYRGWVFYFLPDEIGPGGVYSLPRREEGEEAGREELLAFDYYNASRDAPRQKAFGFGEIPRVVFVKDGSAEDRSWPEDCAVEHALAGVHCKEPHGVFLGFPVPVSSSTHPSVCAKLSLHPAGYGLLRLCAANVGCVHFDGASFPLDEDFFFVAAPWWTGVAIACTNVSVPGLIVRLRQKADEAARDA